MAINTTTPVTTSGWYERTDGTVGKYVWRSGRLCEDRAVASWADVPSREEEEAENIEPTITTMHATRNANGRDVTLAQIRALHDEAKAAGDESMVDTCLDVLAYGGGEVGRAEKDAALEKIAAAINAARAMED